MSFSSIVKNELCRMEITEDCCLLCELAAVIRLSGTVQVIGSNSINIKIATENAAFARRVFSVIKKVYNIYPQVITRKSKRFKRHILYMLVITAPMGAKTVLDSIGSICGHANGTDNPSNYIEKVLKDTCCKKAYLRGAFLACGSISDPEKTYNLEVAVRSESLADEIKELVNQFGLNSKVIKRKGNFVTYIKEGENIVDFLNIVGAHSALMELENIRILKEMRNNVNRIVNCETANLVKTVNASFRQVENIKYIRDNMGFGSLPRGLKEVAEIRVEFSDASLKELGEMLSPPLGKSGVNHRLRKLDKIAEDLRKERGEI